LRAQSTTAFTTVPSECGSVAAALERAVKEANVIRQEKLRREVMPHVL
jgi:hypothetical protein